MTGDALTPKYLSAACALLISIAGACVGGDDAGDSSNDAGEDNGATVPDPGGSDILGSTGAPDEPASGHTFAENLCSYNERCDSAVNRIYGTGADCIETVNFLYDESLFAQDPDAQALFDSFAECSENLRTVTCADDGPLGVALALSDHLASCTPDVPQQGEACDGSCAPGLACAGGDSSSCGVCVPEGTATCESRFDCGRSYFCEDSQCLPLKPDGAACAGDDECTSLLCDGRTADTDGVCTPLAAQGEPCEEFGDCDIYLVCTDGKCALPGLEGERCERNFLGCRFNLACHHGICTPQMRVDNPIGGPCAWQGRCVAGAYCKDDGECAPVPDVGETCDRSTVNNCGTDARCTVDDVCESLRPDGAGCTFGGECESERCDSGSCAVELICE